MFSINEKKWIKINIMWGSEKKLIGVNFQAWGSYPSSREDKGKGRDFEEAISNNPKNSKWKSKFEI